MKRTPSTNAEDSSLVIAGEVSVYPVCAIFRYTEEELLTKRLGGHETIEDIRKETEQVLLKGIDLNLYGYLDPVRQKILPLTKEVLTTPSQIRIPNELCLRIVQNASDGLVGGNEALRIIGKRVMELIPDLRRQLLYMKVFPPRLLLQLLAGINKKFTSKQAEIRFENRNSASFTLHYSPDLTRLESGPSSPARCAGFRGAVEGIMEFFEVSRIEVKETECICDGAPHCTYRISWAPPSWRNRLRNTLQYLLFRETILSFQHAEAARDHEIFVITANLRAEHRKLQNTTRELAEANRLLEELSSRDGLTGVKNRGFFDSRIQLLARKLSRLPDEELSLVLLDIDNFKQLNDSFGHQAGDRSLIAVSAILTASARRPDDFAARYGGEEFALVLPHTSGPAAAALAERFRREVEQSAACRPREDYPITVSAGIGTVKVDAGNIAGTISDLIGEADRNLYRAKAAGRNRVCL